MTMTMMIGRLAFKIVEVHIFVILSRSLSGLNLILFFLIPFSQLMNNNASLLNSKNNIFIHTLYIFCKFTPRCWNKSSACAYRNTFA